MLQIKDQLNYPNTEGCKTAEAINRLKEKFPRAGCTLKYDNPFQLLVAAILFTRSNEQTVNQITGKLFNAYPRPKELMDAERPDIEGIIRPTGFYRRKAKHLTGTAQILVKQFKGQIPKSLTEITKLPGVARKTGNLIMGELYQSTEGVQVDVHIQRVSARLELSRGKLISKVEQDLMHTIPQEHWVQLPYLMTALANSHCFAQRPTCHTCPLSDICPSSTAH